MALASLCREDYILGKVLLSAAYHKELSMHGQPQDTPPLAMLSPEERTRALERYQMLQPCVEHGVPLTHVAGHHDVRCGPCNSGWPNTGARV